MDTVEATKMVMSRIQKLDPENATKIMGYILIQDQGENEMIRLAFGPENLLVSVMKQAKSFLDISSNTSCASRNTPQIIIPNHNGGGFHHLNLNPSSPSSPWSLSGSGSGSFPEHIPHRNSPRPSQASYAAVVNGNQNFFNNFNDQSEEFNDQLLEFNEPNWSMESENCSGGHNLHRRSCSVNDMFLAGNVAGDDDGNGGWRPCMYFARGFCKNGTSCKFVHGNGSNNGFCDEIGSGLSGSVGSPTGKMDPFEDLLRFKAIQQQQQQQQRIAAMAAGNGAHFPFNRCMNFINENPRSNAAAALMMGDDFHKFGRCRPDRNDFGPMGFGNSNSSSRQIYLTFPADSTFKEEDVSNYFSMFGPVQDVRIPYQQKRMFGFVTFMLPETVKAILAKGNPHFVCDSRVLVKPYKEKGKIPDKKHHQQMERGDFSGCLSPTALESVEPFDHIPFGARMFNHEMMIRRKIEERELQQAIEFQDRRWMNLQLNDLKHHQFQRSLSLGVTVPSPTQMMNQNAFSSNGNIEEFVSGAKVSPQNSMHSASDESDHNVPPDFNVDDENAADGQDNSDHNETDKNESFEHSLPDNLFASPTKSAASDHQTLFTTDMPETDYPSVSVTPKCQAIEM